MTTRNSFVLEELHEHFSTIRGVFPTLSKAKNYAEAQRKERKDWCITKVIGATKVNESQHYMSTHNNREHKWERR